MKNREIKFIFWNGKDMVSDVYADLSINEFFEESSKYYESVMQFTGLHDKNGKEIYGFDILKNPQDKKGVVIFEDGSFKLQVHKSVTSAHYLSLNMSYLDNKEIIGNIFENPELLK